MNESDQLDKCEREVAYANLCPICRDWFNDDVCPPKDPERLLRRCVTAAAAVQEYRSTRGNHERNRLAGEY